MRKCSSVVYIISKKIWYVYIYVYICSDTQYFSGNMRQVWRIYTFARKRIIIYNILLSVIIFLKWRITYQMKSWHRFSELLQFFSLIIIVLLIYAPIWPETKKSGIYLKLENYEILSERLINHSEQLLSCTYKVVIKLRVDQISYDKKSKF